MHHYADVLIYFEIVKLSKVSHMVELFSLKNHEKLYLTFERI